MPGHSVGTMFVELDLDASRYTKGQQRLLRDATSTTLNIEANFKKMGIKSSAEFDLLRARAENAFNRIKNSNQVTANDIVRAEKAKNDQLRRLNEQQFGKQTSLLQTLKSNWIATTGAIIAAWYGVRKVIGIVSDVALAAARYETLGVAMETVGRNAGYSAIQMMIFQKGLEETGISMSGARQALTRMAQAQLDLTYSSNLARIAQDAAVIGAMNSTEAFNNLVYGIQTANVRVLRTIGINVSWEESYAKVAKQLGRTTNSFTEAEKATIRLNAVLEAGKRITGTYEAAMGTAGKKLYSLERFIENFKVTMGQGFLPVLGDIVDEMTKWFKINGQMLAQDVAGWIRGTYDMLKIAIKPLQVWVELWQTLGWISSGTKEMMPGKGPQPPKEIPSGKTGYPDMSSLLEKSSLGEVKGEDITAKDKAKMEDLTDFWRVQYEQRYEIQANALQRMIELDEINLQEASQMKKDFWEIQIQDRADILDREFQLESQAKKRLQMLDIQASHQKMTIARGLGTALLGMVGANNQAIFAATQAFDAAMAIISGYAAGARALAELGPIAGPPVMTQMIELGYLQAAAIAATAIGQMATSGNMGGGTYTSPVVTTTSPIASIPETTPEKKGDMNIYLEGPIIGTDAKELAEYLAELLSDGVENYNIRLISSGSKRLED